MQCFRSGRPATLPYGSKVKLGVPGGGPYLFIFFSLSAKTDLATILITSKGEVRPGHSDPVNGNIEVTMGNVSVRFRSWCAECVFPICFQVMGQTKAKECGTWFENGGWCLLGQGEFTKEGEIELRHTPLGLEQDPVCLFSVDVLEIPRDKKYILPTEPLVFREWVESQLKWRKSLKIKNHSFDRISHPWIAVHCGAVPRDLYYWKGINVSNEFLEGILQIGFIGCDLKSLKGDITGVAERVVFSLTHFVNVTVDYQPDMVYSRKGIKSFEYFSKGLLGFAGKADCEDLAWYMSSLLESIQTSKPKKDTILSLAHEALQEYIPASAIVQGTAPEFRKSRYNLCFKPIPFESETKDQELQGLMHIFHVTCFLFPKREFLECVNRGQPLSGQPIVKIPVVGKTGLHRLYCEPTACVGEDPEERLLSELEEAFISPDDPLCVPVGWQSPDATLIYGALVEVITNWFIREKTGPQCITFLAALQTTNGEFVLTPEDCHWGQPGANFAFIPSRDITPLITLTDKERRFTRDIPFPVIDKLPEGFEQRLRALQAGYFKNNNLFNKRFWCRLSTQKEDGGFEHPMRKGVWIHPPL